LLSSKHIHYLKWRKVYLLIVRRFTNVIRQY
jgi:hypothetical protein